MSVDFHLCPGAPHVLGVDPGCIVGGWGRAEVGIRLTGGTDSYLVESFTLLEFFRPSLFAVTEEVLAREAASAIGLARRLDQLGLLLTG